MVFAGIWQDQLVLFDSKNKLPFIQKCKIIKVSMHRSKLKYTCIAHIIFLHYLCFHTKLIHKTCLIILSYIYIQSFIHNHKMKSTHQYEI